MLDQSHRVPLLVVSGALGCALLAPALARAQGAPAEPSAPKQGSPPPAVDPEQVKRLEQRIAELEARVRALSPPATPPPAAQAPPPAAPAPAPPPALAVTTPAGKVSLGGYVEANY